MFIRFLVISVRYNGLNRLVILCYKRVPEFPYVCHTLARILRHNTYTMVVQVLSRFFHLWLRYKNNVTGSESF